jgi:hypothetical protein
MRQEIFTTLRVIAASAAIFAGNCYAATYGTQVAVSPMPFSPGQTVTIKANVSGPFSNAKAYVSVSDGTQTFDIPVQNVGVVASGQSIPFSTTWKVPIDLHAKMLSVFVVFLEGDEKYVGEPGHKSLQLVARCPRGGKAARPCRYATGRYWAETTKVK